MGDNGILDIGACTVLHHRGQSERDVRSSPLSHFKRCIPCSGALHGLPFDATCKHFRDATPAHGRKGREIEPGNSQYMTSPTAAMPGNLKQRSQKGIVCLNNGSVTLCSHLEVPQLPARTSQGSCCGRQGALRGV